MSETAAIVGGMSRLRTRKDLLVHDVPPEIRNALVQDAQARNVSVNDAAVSILAEHYKVEHRPSGVGFTSVGDTANLAIRGGNRLHKKIDMDRARRGGGTLRGVVLERLALHYGLEPPPIGRRPRRSISSSRGRHGTHDIRDSAEVPSG